MNWEAIGSIGELLSATAVLITLVYLAKQVRDAKKSIRRQIYQDVNGMFNATHHVIASNPELSSALANLEAGKELSRSQFYQVRAIFLATMNGMETMYFQAKESDDFMDIQELMGIVIAYLEEPGIRTYWNDYKFYLTKEFQQIVSEFENLT